MKGDYNYCYIAISLVTIWLLLNFIRNKGWFKKGKEDIVSSSKVFQPSIKFLLYFALFFLAFSFLAPWVFTRDSKQMPIPITFDANSGVIGDTVGGLMNPFVAIAGVIVTGLAFYIQYQANKQVQDQFKLQQFESQFYEMLKLHKENVNEMSIEGYNYETQIEEDGAMIIYTHINDDSFDLNQGFPDQSKNRKEIEGRKIFYLMVKELHALYHVIKYVCIKINPLDLDEKLNFINDKLKNEYFKLAYNIFFSGKDILKIQIDLNQLNHLNIQRKSDFFNELIKELEKIRKCHKRGLRYLKNYINKGESKKSLHIDISYKPFSGHQIRLAHFYRHMHSIVNFVINQNNDILNYEEKRKYLKMFRAQLSNHEIVLLYYNWLGGHGEAWEHSSNKFFTDFRMIHNINSHLILSEFDVETFFDEDIYQRFKYKSGRRKNDLLFELYGVVSQIPENENAKLINN
ncbi:putative phage abortive infection protein [uncultured Pedobacter sp.]|uniref:putative phage abortive infection protein n=1 Tax=uncultured Pedobacter sp. TaxID=246139 RepID=UPI0025D7CE93|nr:putative phage abortive infection protein [uncultured Pedobacter sp.]